MDSHIDDVRMDCPVVSGMHALDNGTRKFANDQNSS